MTARERRWLVLASDGRHVWAGRAVDPTPEHLGQVTEGLRGLGLGGWLAVSEGAYYGPGPIRLMPVRPLVELPDATWDAAAAAFMAIRKAVLTS